MTETEETETPSLEAYRITVTYGFDSNGVEYVTVTPDEDMSAILLTGILDYAKFKIQHPEYDEDDD